LISRRSAVLAGIAGPPQPGRHTTAREERLRGGEPEVEVVLRGEDSRDGIFGRIRGIGATTGARTGSGASPAAAATAREGGELILQLLLPVQRRTELWQVGGASLQLLATCPLHAGFGQFDALTGSARDLERVLHHHAQAEGEQHAVQVIHLVKSTDHCSFQYHPREPHQQW
jgi:hypothetical protein